MAFEEGARRRMKKVPFIVVGFVVLAIPVCAQISVPPDKEALLKGEGAGQFVAAEQTKYPTPEKVLAFKEQLGLTKLQIKKIEELMQNLPVSAQVKGQEIVEAEEDLNQAFAAGTINDKTLRAKVEKIGKLRSELRFGYLQVCLKVKQILSSNQIERYKELVASENK